MSRKIERVLIPREKISEMVARVGAEISSDYEGRSILLIGVLKGAFIFMSDLVRCIRVPLQVDFMSVSSYGANTATSGIVRILKDLDTDITGRHVIIVEDIVDTGLTLQYLTELLTTRDPASIAICAAFDKPDRRKADIRVDYRGMTIPDEFIVGYGLDYAEDYRHLPDVCVLGENGGSIS